MLILITGNYTCQIYPVSPKHRTDSRMFSKDVMFVFCLGFFVVFTKLPTIHIIIIIPVSTSFCFSFLQIIWEWFSWRKTFKRQMFLESFHTVLKQTLLSTICVGFKTASWALVRISVQDFMTVDTVMWNGKFTQGSVIKWLIGPPLVVVTGSNQFFYDCIICFSHQWWRITAHNVASVHWCLWGFFHSCLKAPPLHFSQVEVWTLTGSFQHLDPFF